MAFKSVKSIVDAETEGRTFISSWIKKPTATTPANVWYDLAMATGNPIAQTYAGNGSSNIGFPSAYDREGIQLGPTVTTSGFVKHIKSFSAMCSGISNMPMILCDYLMFYSWLNSAIIGQQSLATATPQSRYSLGAKVMAVQTASQSGSTPISFIVGYTNDRGVSGKFTPVIKCNNSTTVGNIITSNTAPGGAGPFLPLAPGDTGVRTLDSIEFLTQDTGIISLVIVMPLESINLVSPSAPSEKISLLDFSHLPTIGSDNPNISRPYLNLICLPSGNLSGTTIIGTIETFWS